jgi:hypothetical protein
MLAKSCDINNALKSLWMANPSYQNHERRNEREYTKTQQSLHANLQL